MANNMSELGRLLQDIKSSLSVSNAMHSQIVDRLMNLENAQSVSNATQTQILDRLNKLEKAQSALGGKIDAVAIGTRAVTAGARVAVVPELLEAILLNLGTRDLLFAQRVSRGFKTTIDGSVKLQRALFFLPEPAYGEPRLNELIFDPTFFTKQSLSWSLFTRSGGWGDDTQCLKPAYRHMSLGSASVLGSGLAVEFRCAPEALPCRGQEGMPDQLDPERANADVVARCKVCVEDKRSGMKAGSWERMYATQPHMDMHWTWPIDDEWQLGDYHMMADRVVGQLFDGQALSVKR